MINYLFSIVKLLVCTYLACVWNQRDIPEPRPQPRYGQSHLYLDEKHLLVLGGCGGPNNVFNDVWLLVMESPHWRWVRCEIRNGEHAALHMWCHQAVRYGIGTTNHEFICLTHLLRQGWHVGRRSRQEPFVSAVVSVAQAGLNQEDWIRRGDGCRSG